MVNLWVVYSDDNNIILYFRNLGVDLVVGKYLVFLDVDVLFVLNWFNVMVDIFKIWDNIVLVSVM